MIRGQDLQRLPIDVLASGADRDRRPDPSAFPLSVAEYGRQHARALAGGLFADRVTALWGLIAHGDAAIPWCRDALSSVDTELIGDALSVLAWVGTPADLVPALTLLLDQLPDSELRDAVYTALPESVIATRDAEEGAVSRPEQEGVPLAGSMDPFTQTIYFLRARYEATVKARHKAWKSNEAMTEHQGPLLQLLALLEPYSHPHWKALVVECQGEWTAVFDQGADLTNTAHFATELRTLGVRTSYSPHVRGEGQIIRYGNTAFWMTDGSRKDLRPLCVLRSIQASYQSGWQWDISGEPQAWEDTERYARRRVRERFDLELMNQYCRALGIRRDEAAFYGPRATLFAGDTSRWQNRPNATPGAEWRRQHTPG
jgi:hypothetical protein